MKIHAFIVTSLLPAALFAAIPGNIASEGGTIKITARDLVLADKVEKVKYPGVKSGRKALSDAAVLAKIMKKYERPVTPVALENEHRRIENQLEVPRQINQVKTIFGRDYDAYRRVFVLPILAERVLHDEVFLGDRKVREQFKQPAAEFIAEASASKDFEELAKDRKLEVVRAVVTTEKVVPVAPPEGYDASNTREAAQFWLETVVPGMKPMQVLNRPVERPEAWYAIRYIGAGENPGEHVLEFVAFPKKNFEQWLNEERRLATAPASSRKS